ncbi:hypothetical protein PT287_00605 [Lactobacillus sp. ESL0679]|uniref:hypothetical protein n=1 Tax=unclassified Lactobacillus TaxID=2620435 RepID=UPI0023F6329E|nr:MULTISPECIES: hypothetical protein [unclassified Lactobacillus]MDF7682022.1 hypothetical protein [Lactobacillus sp. ESL0679]WEV50719.1 hypothetical protein OZX63_07130 [Lactobacillus sp. ESL0700]WEV61849.1 hypothetical protein OZX69_07135 [Lactobacillus sp. ESL0731]
MKVSLFTAIIVLIVGLYDMAYSYNRRRHNQRGGGTTAFMILGIIFVIGGIAMMILHWVK